MSHLLYTRKYPAYKNGNRAEKTIFLFGENADIRVRAVRKYKNDNNENKFKTVEIRAKQFKELIELSNLYQNRLCESLEELNDCKNLVTKQEQEIRELQDKVAILEESW